MAIPSTTHLDARSGPPPWLMPALWITLGLYLAGVVCVATLEVRQRGNAVRSAIDNSLRTGATTVPYLLVPGFHDRAREADSIANDEDERNISILSRHADEAGFTYLYTVIRDPAGRLRFTASSATGEERASGKITHYWDDYDDAPPEIDLTLADGVARFAEYTDRWGSFRSVFLRQRSPGGQPFLVCADYDLAVVRGQWRWAVAGAFIAGTLQGLFGLVLVLVVRRTLRRLERSQRGLHLLSLVAHSSDHGVLIGDADQRVLWSNAAFLRLSGIAADLVQGRMLHDLLSFPGDAEAGRKVAAVLAGTTSASIEGPAPGGRWLQTDVQPVLGAEGRIVNWIAMTSDLSARKAMEDALHQARVAAEAANAAKSSFLANMSHEIRTPMNGVMGMTELLLGTQLSNEQRTYARTVYTSAENLLVLLNDILDLSKIEAGHMALDPQPTDLGVLVHEVVELFRPRLVGMPIELMVRIAPGTRTGVRIDPLRIRQVVGNLLGNAVKFTRQGHILIDLSSGPSPRPGVVRVVIRVEDTGCGIPADRVPLLFQPFSQADPSTARHFGGTGLGLAISRRLTSLMDGDIQLTSREGHGSVFTVTLDLAPAEVMSSTIRPSLAVLAGMAVLVVDDNEVNRSILIEVLSGCGARPVAVAGAGEALLELGQAAGAGSPFPLMITDFRMPGMDGAELAAQVRADPDLGAPAVVLYTSEPAACSLDSAGAIGCAGYLVKPARAEAVLGVLAMVAQRPESPGPVTVHSLARISHPAQPASGRPSVAVLLAEDNVVNQQVASALLGRLGCTVEVAADGAVAVAAVARGGHALVFMDCMMPGTDGFQATSAIRAAEAGTGTHLPIIAMTASALAGDRERCLAAGMDDFIAKPVRGEDLARMLDRWARPGGR